MRNSILTTLCLIWCALPCAAADISISAAKLLPDSPTNTISLKAKVVTYASANYFYIEEDNRNMGIKVEKTAHGLTVGMRADVTGTMKTNSNRERAILAAIAAHNGDGTVAPVGTNNLALGGGNWNVVGTGGQKGTSSSIGLNNIGLLVKTWGKYQLIDSTNFTVDDGSGLYIKCTVPAGTFLYSEWQYIAVTGICSIYKPNSTTYWPTIMVRDIQVVSPIYVIEMIDIPAGSFVMGTVGTGGDENPQHSVTLGAYSIGKYEVTRGQYQAFMDSGGYTNSSYWSTAGWSWKLSYSPTEPYYWAAAQDWYGGQPFTQTDSFPVVGVSYYESEAFCNWAGGHLPTEAQWERAACWTVSSARVYPWGDTWNNEYCNNWYDSNAASGGYQKYQTAPVGSYSSYGSPSGCQDMAGNVWEWCKDWYQSNYYSTSPSSDPQGPTSGSYRVLRGGGWYGNDNTCRCAYRGLDPPYNYSSHRGFRLVR
ncbi:MAG: formylglycine-generating enzyme family protein [Armatimonadetes bacterium]|nr:formylglycine-generating enzyme family protein [Armatimonadota bacterium]